VADSGDGGYTTFRRFVAWAGASWAVFARKPQLVFEDCTLLGQTTVFSASRPEDGTRLLRCHLEDRDHPTHGAVYRSGVTLNAPNAHHFEAVGCEIVGRVNKPIYLLAAPGRERAARLRDTRVVVMNATLPPGDFQVYLSNVVLTRVRVVDALTGPAPRPGYYVEAGAGNIIEGGVVVPATVRYGNAVSAPSASSGAPGNPPRRSRPCTPRGPGPARREQPTAAAGTGISKRTVRRYSRPSCSAFSGR
jgi:hypothetical protein